MKALHMIAFILVIIGGLNWLLVGLGNWNLVSMIFGIGTLARVIYVLVGLSAVVLLFTHKKDCKTCSGSSAAM